MAAIAVILLVATWYTVNPSARPAHLGPFSPRRPLGPRFLQVGTSQAELLLDKVSLILSLLRFSWKLKKLSLIFKETHQHRKFEKAFMCIVLY